jgi:hypothetical protein
MYTPNNDLVFTAAFAGCLAGMAASGRNPTSITPADYNNTVATVGAFAQEFDTLWALTPAATLELQTIEEACEGAWSGRAPLDDPSGIVPATWQPLCQGIITIVQAGLAYYTAQSIPNPPAGGGADPLIKYTFYVGETIPATTTPNGTVSAPFPTLQAAIDYVLALSITDGQVSFILSAFQPLGSVIWNAAAGQANWNFECLGGLALIDTFAYDTGVNTPTNSIIFKSVAVADMTLAGGGTIEVKIQTLTMSDQDFDAAEIPGVDDTAWTGFPPRFIVTGGQFVNNWIASQTILEATHSYIGYPVGDFSLNMSLAEFTLGIDCAIQNCAIIVTSIPTTGPALGFISCSFSSLPSFTGPPLSFVADSTSLATFVSAGGTLAGGATVRFLDGLRNTQTMVAPPIVGAGFFQSTFTVPGAIVGQSATVNGAFTTSLGVYNSYVSAPDTVIISFCTVDGTPGETLDITITLF